MRTSLASRITNLDRLTVGLENAATNLLPRRRSRWERAHSSLEALSPKAILARGYALVFDNQGHLVKSSSQLSKGDEVRTQLAEGGFVSKVEKLNNTKQ
jgi:exodeoxyribonuclease VII large subunit